MNLKTVIQRLEKFAPSSLAEGWDNTGLLIEPSNTEKIIKKIMLTNDLTEGVLKEAVERNTDLIISYHPPIFKPLKKISQSSWKERITVICIENEIALYSPHTAYDKISGGVNDWLIAPYDPKLPVPIFPEGKVTKLSLTDLSPDSISTLHTLMSSSVDAVESTPSSIQFSFEDKRLGDVINRLREYDPSLLNKASFDTLTSHIGAGRVSQLKAKLPLKQVVEKTKSHLGLEHVRLALGNGKTKESLMSSIAVCAGSGSSVLSGAPMSDVWLTGEMSHHEVLDAVHRGTSVILCEHSNTERGYLVGLTKKFKEELFVSNKDMVFFVSSEDKDPLVVV
eukprot:TRINITY_DN2528_c0_g1_i1.p1 TRINITY_DN2528_c0_g1~~TRINITY_DN2528_c0_g1_i1.p1  ORF type:complete len:351 (+),score=85.93 TRINITY_DN2528_c0_g1_i1:44-1054(+)